MATRIIVGSLTWQEKSEQWSNTRRDIWMRWCYHCYSIMKLITMLQNHRSLWIAYTQPPAPPFIITNAHYIDWLTSGLNPTFTCLWTISLRKPRQMNLLLAIDTEWWCGYTTKDHPLPTHICVRHLPTLPSSSYARGQDNSQQWRGWYRRVKVRIRGAEWDARWLKICIMSSLFVRNMPSWRRMWELSCWEGR